MLPLVYFAVQDRYCTATSHSQNKLQYSNSPQVIPCRDFEITPGCKCRNTAIKLVIRCQSGKVKLITGIVLMGQQFYILLKNKTRKES